MSREEAGIIGAEAVDRGGRPAATSPHAFAVAAQRLFLEQGFEQTSVEDIAVAVGVSRRTFFRYFSTKADVLWIESDAEFNRLAHHLSTDDKSRPPRDVISEAIISALAFAPDDEEWAMHRTQLILTVPAVQSHAAALYRKWRGAIEQYIRSRAICADDELFTIAFAHATTAAIMTAHEYWMSHPEIGLPQCLRSSIDLLVPSSPRTANDNLA